MTRFLLVAILLLCAACNRAPGKATPRPNILFVLAPNPLLMALVEAGSMAADQVYDVIWPSYRMALIPDELQGRVTSAYRMIFSSMGPIGAALSGILIQQIGAAGELLVMAAFLCAVGVAVMLNPHVRHAPTIEKL